MSKKLLFYKPKIVYDENYNIYLIDTTKTPGNLDVTLQSELRGDMTTWNEITDWGDGTSDNLLTHTYVTDGQYTIKTKYSMSNLVGIKDTNTVNKVIKILGLNKNVTNLKNILIKQSKKRNFS